MRLRAENNWTEGWTVASVAVSVYSWCLAVPTVRGSGGEFNVFVCGSVGCFLPFVTDLVKEEQARDQYEKIKSFVTGTVAEGAPIIPISAQLQYNIDIVAQYIACCVPVPKRDFSSTPRLLVIRSFDVNKPGAEIEQLKVRLFGLRLLSHTFARVLCRVLRVLAWLVFGRVALPVAVSRKVSCELARRSSSDQASLPEPRVVSFGACGSLQCPESRGVVAFIAA